jgi:hypothetical protein
MKKFYYYTHWKFRLAPDGLDETGPYHSTWISEMPPEEFFHGTRVQELTEFYWRQFATEEAMVEFAKTVGLDTRQPEKL